MTEKDKKQLEHYNAVLLEDIKSKMDLVIDGMNTAKHELRAEMGEFRKEVNGRFEVVEGAIRHNSDAIKEVKTEMHAMDARLTQNMHDMEERLSDKIDKSNTRLEDHETRITVLESHRA